jgi:hypothetical protein
MSVVNGTQAGVANATVTNTAAASTWQQLSLTFTPARNGVVTIRLFSRSTIATGSAFFDDFGKIGVDSSGFDYSRGGDLFIAPHSITGVIRAP